ncbi:MAG: hypothetical protein EOP49_08285 [Sphingobacteriales bacterium]|nr:MAG: hypothetical protein EOP49_08285 [Sphingobacteriales bacterium]
MSFPFCTFSYHGIIQWDERRYLNPWVCFSETRQPGSNDLVLVQGEGKLVIVPYSNQERILGVVTGIL